MQDIYAEIVKALERKEKVALATLITRAGSAPRGVGAKYLVKEDGTSVGSIGGGCVEADVWQQAQDVIRDGKGGVLHFKLTAEQLAQGGLICGGNIDIFLEPLAEEFFKIYQEVVKIKRRGGRAVLATLISVGEEHPKGEGAKVLIRTSGEKAGCLADGEELEQRILKEGESLLRENKPRVLSLTPEKGGFPRQEMEVLLEPIISEPVV